jgi:hypothetical protein
MGFLRRLLGGSAPAAPPAARGVNLRVTSFNRMRHDAVVQVVGEAYRQGLVLAARPPGPSDLPPGVSAPPAGQYKAILLPEPTNPHDGNAIAVTLWAGGDWTLVGYLSREDAVAYGPVMRRLHEPGTNPGIACDAALVRERGGTGVILHLGTPGECMAELFTDDLPPASHPWAGQLIVFSGESRSTLGGALVDRSAQLLLAAWAGCEVLPRVTKKAQALVVADHRDLTANTQKARDYGIPIVDERDFLIGIGMPAEAVGRDELAWTR